jgi:hypothetical protein
MAERERVQTGESRGETVRRVVREQEAVMRAEGATPLRDPSSRRHLGTRGLLGCSAVGVAAGTLSAGIVLVAGGGVGLAIALGIAIAIVPGVIAGLLLAEREDGRVEKGMGEHGGG